MELKYYVVISVLWNWYFWHCCRQLVIFVQLIMLLYITKYLCLKKQSIKQNHQLKSCNSNNPVKVVTITHKLLPALLNCCTESNHKIETFVVKLRWGGKGLIEESSEEIKVYFLLIKCWIILLLTFVFVSCLNIWSDCVCCVCCIWSMVQTIHTKSYVARKASIASFVIESGKELLLNMSTIHKKDGLLPKPTPEWSQFAHEINSYSVF